MDAGKNGSLIEVFGTGTAAVVAPVSHLKYKDQVLELDMNKRNLSKWAYETINGIRNRTIEDKFGWIVEA